MNRATYANIIRPNAKSYAFVYDFMLIIGGSLLIAGLGQVAVMLPFSPVPVTGQTLGVLLAGAILGSRRGSCSVIAYVLEGAMGLPVFAMGRGGFAVLAGPTGGYVFGFIAAAFLVGYLCELGFDKNVVSCFIAMVCGIGVIYAFGWAWLSVMLGVKHAFTSGVLPFVFGDIVKILIATLILPAGWKLIKSSK